MPDTSARARRWHAARAARAALAAIVCAFIAAVWLNQSVGGKDWEAARDRVSSGSASVVESIRYPFTFLYRRSHDEQIYWATAGAILGEPIDRDVFERGAVPDAFRKADVPADGHWHAPYVEVPFEYPPPALPFIVLPKLITSSFASYARVFGALMAACLLGAIAIALRVARSGESDDAKTPTRWLFAGALLLAHGGIAIQRLDAVVALLLSLALHAAVRRRPATLGVWLGLAGATKFVPLLLVPVFAAADASFYKSPKRLLTLGAAAAASFVVGLAPMFGGGALRDVLQYHAERGLHVESTLGVIYGAVRALSGNREAATLDFGSYNFHGAVADTLARAAAPLTLVAIAALTVALARAARAADADDERGRVRRLAYAAVAGCATLWLTGKVFSPQYMTWAIPLVLAIPGVEGARAVAALGSALLVSQIYLRGYYDYVCEERAIGIVSIVTRQSLLIALFVLSMRAARPRTPVGSPS
jgi:hypothetical protein